MFKNKSPSTKHTAAAENTTEETSHCETEPISVQTEVIETRDVQCHASEAELGQRNSQVPSLDLTRPQTFCCVCGNMSIHVIKAEMDATKTIFDNPAVDERSTKGVHISP